MQNKSYETAIDKCPRCSYTVDRAMPMVGAGAPAPGDFTVCFNCGDVLVFDDDRKLRFPTEAESREAQSFSTIRSIQAAVRQVRAA